MPFRRVAWLLVLVLVASACGASGSTEQAEEQSGSYGSGVDLDFDSDEQGQSQAQAPQQQEVQPGGAAPAQQPADGGNTSSGGSSATKLTRKPSDVAGSGMNSYFYLNEEVPELVIEVDVVQGREPQRATLDLLHQRLSSVADKPAGIRFTDPEIITASSKSEWSIQDLRQFEAQHRDHLSSRESAVMYVMFLSGELQGRPALGVTYSSSAVAIFVDQVRAAAVPPHTPESIERTTALHEIGHLLALVNLTYTSPRNHADPEHPDHSSNPDSVMYWAYEQVNVVRLLEGRTQLPDDFDADDRADLADLKTGKLG